MNVVSRVTAKLILKKIQEGEVIDDIAADLSVSPYIVARLAHEWVLDEGNETKLERLETVAARNALVSSGNMELKDYAAKQLSKWLFQAGMQSKQVHICTGLSIHKSRHLYRQVKNAFSVAEALIQIPKTLPARLVMSMFSTHYSYMMDQAETNSVQIANVVVAWSRTLDEIRNMNLQQYVGMDPGLASLGFFFEVARSLREVKFSGQTSDQSELNANRKIERGHCPKCDSHFIYFVSSRQEKACQCCYCELNRLIEKDKI